MNSYLKPILLSILFLSLFVFSNNLSAQTVFWFEDFDAGGVNWVIENGAGSKTNPTPAGIVGLTYGTNDAVRHDNFIINDQNTPQLLGGNIVTGTALSSQPIISNGRSYAFAGNITCQLPNPFINTGVGPNKSLHITAYPTCATLIYGGTPQSDDWYCLSSAFVAGDPKTLSEQIAYLNTNINATGKVNIKLTADFYLGGDWQGIKTHSTVLYSVDAGVTWKVAKDSLTICDHNNAGNCTNWERRTFKLPADANNQPDLRIAFRWYDDGNYLSGDDYTLYQSFNVDNIMLTAADKPVLSMSMNISGNACKAQTIALQSNITSTSGIYKDCNVTFSETCPVSSYSWAIAGPGAVTYIGGTSSTSSAPQVTVSANGTYNISLTATNCAGTSTIVETAFITVTNCPPIPNFSANNLTPCVDPLAKQTTVTFTDLSTTNSTPITAWTWTFTPATVTYVGGTNSTSQNPQVTFNATGTYQIALQVTNSEGVATETKVAYINAISCVCASGGGGGGPVNLFTENFTGQTLPSPTTWTLNSTDAGSTAGNENSWIIDATYLGDAFSFFLTTPDRGSGEYLHIKSNTACSGFFAACNAIAAVGTGKKSFVKTPIINTSNVTAVSISFWMLANGDANEIATLYYSIDGGTTWTAHTSYTGIATWTQQTITDANFDNQANLRFGFMLNDGVTATGNDPAFSIDDVSVDGTSSGGGGGANTWIGTTNAWNTATNWSAGTVPVATDDVLIPAQTDICGACVMPSISTISVAKNVCNFGTITLTGGNTLTIDADLLNEGAITTDNATATADVIFANTASTYRGNGTLYDVDIEIASSNLTLESDMTPRSFTISTAGTVSIATHILTLNRNLTKTSGTFTATGGTIKFADACGLCIDQTNTSDITLNAAQAFGDIIINKTTGIKVSLLSAVTHSLGAGKTLTIQNGILDANANTINGAGNLTMTGGEFQLAKLTTAIPELTGSYSLTGGKITLDGAGTQTIKTRLTGSPTTVFSENFEAPAIANGTAIVGNIAGWTETGPSLTAFTNKETSGLTVQTSDFSISIFGSVTEIDTLKSSTFSFGTTVNNPTITFDYEIIDGMFGLGTVELQVLQKSATTWTSIATYTGAALVASQTVSLTGTSSSFQIGFRVKITDNGAVGITSGNITIDNIVVTGEAPAPTLDYYDVKFAGTGIKSLNNGNLNVNNQLTLSLPTTLGNYVNAGTDTVKILKKNLTGIVRTGGHVVGALFRTIASSGGPYSYYIGSTNADLETYYEPIYVTTTSLSGPSAIIANFNDSPPSPATVNPLITFASDTIQNLETEGYWHLGIKTAVIGGSYAASVSPDANYWAFAKTWKGGQHALIKQTTTGGLWSFSNGGLRVNDSTTASFTNFSNFALGYSKNAALPASLPIDLITFKGYCNGGTAYLSWVTASEINSDKFILEKSVDGKNYSYFAEVEAAGEANTQNKYIVESDASEKGYYKLSEINYDGKKTEYGITYVDCGNNNLNYEVNFFPNPSSGIVSMSLFAEKKGSLYLSVYDLLGNTVHSKSMAVSVGITVEHFDLSFLPSGTYIIKSNLDNYQDITRLIITK